MLDERQIAPTTTSDWQLPVATTTNWRAELPVLRGAKATLRELRQSDAAVLLAMMSSDEVARFISPAPKNIEGFERFIDWTARERAAGRSLTFGIVPDGFDEAVGLIQVRALDSGFDRAEWGFAIGSMFWGLGMFQESATMAVDFAIETAGVHRLEARAMVNNGRGNGALRKLGAVEECLLRKSFVRNGDYRDQILWSIVAEDWLNTESHSLQAKTVWGARIH
jgi:RimJ/RimL family protein N-acetyltransferase